MKERLIELIGSDWYEAIGDWFETSTAKTLIGTINKRREKVSVYPDKNEIFSAFKLTRLDSLKAVIVGLSPYHTEYNNEPVAHGLAFSSRSNGHIPESLKIIFKEMDEDLAVFPPLYYDRLDSEYCPQSNLSYLADQGVLLLNTLLTCEKGIPLAHENIGWENFVQYVLDKIGEKHPNMTYACWGKQANDFNIKGTKLTAAHPAVHLHQEKPIKSFLGCKHFSKINEHLIKQGKESINWYKFKEV